MDYNEILSKNQESDSPSDQQVNGGKVWRIWYRDPDGMQAFIPTFYTYEDAVRVSTTLNKNGDAEYFIQKAETAAASWEKIMKSFRL